MIELYSQFKNAFGFISSKTLTELPQAWTKYQEITRPWVNLKLKFFHTAFTRNTYQNFTIAFQNKTLRLHVSHLFFSCSFGDAIHTVFNQKW